MTLYNRGTEESGDCMTTLTTEALTETVGVEILGVDGDRLLNDPDLPEQVLSILDANGVVLFRELHLDDETQVAFSKRLGRVETFRNNPELPELFRVSLDPSVNPTARYLRGTFDWHIDGMTEDVPISATILSAHVIAASGGETEFSSTYQAYEDLSEEEKAEFETIRVVHTVEASQRLHTPNPTEEQVKMWRSRPSKTHPLIWTHESGRKSVVLGATADHIEGRDPEEGRQFLSDLLERVTVPERVYRHHWTVGDMVIWDNTGVLHRACPYDPSAGRDMHRTTLYGNEAIR